MLLSALDRRGSLIKESGPLAIPPNQIEILLVEDNPQDAELALRALQKHNLANHVHSTSSSAPPRAFPR